MFQLRTFAAAAAVVALAVSASTAGAAHKPKSDRA